MRRQLHIRNKYSKNLRRDKCVLYKERSTRFLFLMYTSFGTGKKSVYFGVSSRRHHIKFVLFWGFSGWHTNKHFSSVKLVAATSPSFTISKIVAFPIKPLALASLGGADSSLRGGFCPFSPESRKNEADLELKRMYYTVLKYIYTLKLCTMGVAIHQSCAKGHCMLTSR